MSRSQSLPTQMQGAGIFLGDWAPVRKVLGDRHTNIAEPPSSVLNPKKQSRDKSAQTPIPAPGGRTKRKHESSAVSDKPADKRSRQDLQDNLKESLSNAVAQFKRNSALTDSGWLRVLGIRLRSIEKSGDYRDVAYPAITEPFEPPDLSDYDPKLRSAIQEAFGALELTRQEMMRKISPATSTSASASTESSLDLPPRKRRPPAIRPGITFLSPPFYTFSQSRRATAHLLPSDDDYRLALQAAENLITSRTLQPTDIFKALSQAIPDGQGYHWLLDKPSPNNQAVKYSLVYQRIQDQYPAIIVEMSDDEGARDYLLARCGLLYSMALERLDHVQMECGAPVIFITLSGLTMSFAGGFCDSPHGSVVSQLLPGAVNLVDDWGYNCQEASHSLWSLQKSVACLRQVVKPGHKIHRQYIPQAPRVGLESGFFTLTEALKEGVIYKAQLDFGRAQFEQREVVQILQEKGLDRNPCGTTYTLKAIYPSQGRTYGISTHELLAQHTFAPAFYCEFAPRDGTNLFEATTFKPDPLVKYYLADYLAPPTRGKPGWITLENLAQHVTVAQQYKPLVVSTLHRIISILDEADLVHGDLRPNNILIRVELIGNHSCKPLFKRGLDYLDIAVVDYDWSGKAGEVRYPLVRNRDLTYWPGTDGAHIEKGEDKQMVDSWMALWPEQFCELSDVPGDLK